MSWHSRLDNFLPLAFSNVIIINLNRLSNGAGPEARPPNIFKTAPAGLTLLKSYSPDSSISLTLEFIGIMGGGLTLVGGLLGIVSTALAVNRYLRLDLGRLH